MAERDTQKEIAEHNSCNAREMELWRQGFEPFRCIETAMPDNCHEARNARPENNVAAALDFPAVFYANASAGPEQT